MKLLVPIKRVVDPYVKLHLSPQGENDTAHVKKVTNPFDEIALEEAIRSKEQGRISNITVLSIGSLDVVENLRGALAMGADEAIHILTDLPLEPLQIARILANQVRTHAFELVFMGKQATDDDCNQVGQMLAACLKWPIVCFASKIEWSPSELKIESEVDDGIDVYESVWPLIVTVDLRLNEPRYPTLPNIMKSKQKPLTTIPLADLKNIEGLSTQTRLNLSLPPVRKKGILLKNAAELFDILKNSEHVL